jgi:hypothetical protein
LSLIARPCGRRSRFHGVRPGTASVVQGIESARRRRSCADLVVLEESAGGKRVNTVYAVQVTHSSVDDPLHEPILSPASLGRFGQYNCIAGQFKH